MKEISTQYDAASSDNGTFFCKAMSKDGASFIGNKLDIFEFITPEDVFSFLRDRKSDKAFLFTIKY